MISAGLTLLTLTGATLAAGPASAARPAGIAWHRCAEDPAAECGTLSVPVNWSEPYGPHVGIAVARRRATSSAARIGSLVVNPGGPGGSGVDFALGSAEFFTPALRGRFDIVGFDPRGIGRSTPVVCSAGVLAQTPSPVIDGARAFQRTVAFNRRLAADCRRRTGPLFDHVDTLSVVKDMDALRAALGEQQISYYGISYGTLLGQQYAEQFPARLRALVLDSSMDHTLDTATFLDTEAAAAQDSFDQFVAWCRRDTSCELRGRDIHALWAGLLQRAARGQLADPVDPGHKLTPYELVAVAHGAFYTPEWYALANYLDAAADGTPTAARTTSPLVYENPFPAVFCSDWSFPIRDAAAYAAHLRRLATIAPDMRYSPLGLTGVAGCLGAPVRTVNPQRAPKPSSRPILVLNAAHDPATAYPWAVGASRQLGATLLTYDGWGHTVYGRGPCTTATVDRYLVGMLLPATGTHCPAVAPDPFGIGRSSRFPVRRPTF